MENNEELDSRFTDNLSLEDCRARMVSDGIKSVRLPDVKSYYVSVENGIKVIIKHILWALICVVIIHTGIAGLASDVFEGEGALVFVFLLLCVVLCVWSLISTLRCLLSRNEDAKEYQLVHLNTEYGEIVLRFDRIKKWTKYLFTERILNKWLELKEMENKSGTANESL